ncbi:MAG: TonB-dependent receptor, partial [Bacteroidetes bacterium]|nr:TonB-dependent receptor [Bacteroidota bacterium]
MKTRHFFFLAIFVYLLGMSTLAAQTIESALLRGIITNHKGEPVPYANAALLSLEGVLLEGAVTDETGNFSISTTKTARVKLVVSSLGYTSFSSEEFELLAGLQKDFGKIVLADEVTGLDEVTVQASRPQIIIEPDKTIVNVEGTVMAEGANALDVLGRSPGVFVTSDGSINLNGRTGVTVMINDRPMYMSVADLTSFLRSMPADNIKSIEVMTSPSARFDAEGAAGVINIQLKKNTVDGVFGNVMIGGRYNGKGAPNTGLTLNVKKGKWTSNGTFNYNEDVEINDLEIARNFQLEGGKSTFLQDSRIVERSHTPSFTGAANYELTPTQNLGINVQASTSTSNGLNTSGTSISNPGQSNKSSFTSINDSEDQRSRLFTNLHYDAKLDTLGGKISADLDLTVMDMSSEALLTNSYSNGLNPPTLSRDRVLTLNDMYYTIFTSKVDWIQPLKGGKVLEAGLKGSWVESDNDLDLSRGISDAPLQPDPNSNRFIYQENVLAAYSSLKGDFSKKLSYQAGLRMEYSDVTGTSKTLNQVNRQEYVNLFPSMFLQHKISDSYQVVYNVNRRITRPNYRLLNPFVYYIDPLTTEKGNPSLRPQ